MSLPDDALAPRAPQVPPPDGFRVQPHGVVVVARLADLTITHVSESAQTVLGQAPDALVGAPLSVLLPPHDAEAIAARVAEVGVVRYGAVELSSGGLLTTHAFRVSPELVGIDVAPKDPAARRTEATVIGSISAWNDALDAADTQQALIEHATATVFALSGFDGVWACRLEPDGNGIVAAAKVAGPTQTVIGQSVLASDMPPPAHVEGPRPTPFVVADVAAPAARLLPSAPPGDVDLSRSTLGVRYEPFLQRLQELGVRATLSLPIVVDGQPWGMLIAHHPRPFTVSLAVQAELALLATATATRLGELIDGDRTRDRLARARSMNRLLGIAGDHPEIVDGLVADPEALMSLCDATGVLLSFGGRTAAVGVTPGQAEAERLLDAVRERLSGEATATTVAETTMNAHADIGISPEIVCGYLAAKLTDEAEDVIVWLRPESTRSVVWVEHAAVGETAPDDLFLGMKERIQTERGSCRPWSSAEQDAVLDFRDALGGLMMVRVRQLSALNAELRRSNDEFNAFSHAAAHDLKQPIRGIRQYTEFFLEDVAHKLDPGEREMLQTVIDLSAKTADLLNDLMTYAQVGEGAIDPETIDLEAAVTDALELIPPDTRGDAAVEVRPGTLVADPTGLRQLLLNLLVNACKFATGRPEIAVEMLRLDEVAVTSRPPITLSDLPADTCILAVTDRGIGIPEAHQDEIFDLFRKLHATGTKGSGSGAGLALCRRIARRHGGDIWVRSSPDQGSTFFAALDVPSRRALT